MFWFTHENPMRTSITMIAFLVTGIFAYGQGQVVFINTASILISTNSVLGGPATGPILGPPGNYYFALFSAPSGTVDRSVFTFSGAYGTNTATAGRFNGGQPSIPGAPADTIVSLLVRGWSANIGTDYAAVQNYLANPTFDAWYGESQIAVLQLGRGDPFPNPSLFGTFQGSGLNQIPGFTLELNTVPEPSSFALAGFGAAALWLFRRRSP